MTQEQIIKNCENLLEAGSEQNPLYQMLYTMMNMLMEMEAARITGSEKEDTTATGQITGAEPETGVLTPGSEHST